MYCIQSLLLVDTRRVISVYFVSIYRSIDRQYAYTFIIQTIIAILLNV